MCRGTEQSLGSVNFPSSWVQRNRLLASLPASYLLFLVLTFGVVFPQGREEGAGWRHGLCWRGHPAPEVTPYVPTQEEC